MNSGKARRPVAPADLPSTDDRAAEQLALSCTGSNSLPAVAVKGPIRFLRRREDGKTGRHDRAHVHMFSQRLNATG